MQAIATRRTTSTHNMMPWLSASEEMALCRRWHDHHDVAAADRLIDSQLHLVAEVAKGHSNFGVPTQVLIGEGYVGLMRAACRYDPSCGTRFSTFAAWRVQATIHQSVLRASPSIQAETTAAEIAIPPLYPRVNGQRASAGSHRKITKGGCYGCHAND